MTTDEKFVKHLNWCSAEVAKWPGWKQNVLGQRLHPVTPVADNIKLIREKDSV